MNSRVSNVGSLVIYLPPNEYGSDSSIVVYVDTNRYINKYLREIGYVELEAFSKAFQSYRSLTQRISAFID